MYAHAYKSIKLPLNVGHVLQVNHFYFSPFCHLQNFSSPLVKASKMSEIPSVVFFEKLDIARPRSGTFPKNNLTKLRTKKGNHHSNAHKSSKDHINQQQNHKSSKDYQQ